MDQGGEKELLVEEAAREMGLTTAQVRNLFYDGKLQGRYRSERKILIFASSIKKLQEKLDQEKGIGRRHMTLF